MVTIFFVLQDLKANESRLRDINKVASELESEGLMAEEAPMVQAQVKSACLFNKYLSFSLICNCNLIYILYFAATRVAWFCSWQG